MKFLLATTCRGATWHSSSCFRREAGTYGKDTHGLFRVHQFQKIEQLIISIADEQDSERWHDELLANSEEIVQDLGLPYRVVQVCTGDLGVGQYRKHDIETWMPSRHAYGETHSCSTLLDFQSRTTQDSLPRPRQAQNAGATRSTTRPSPRPAFSFPYSNATRRQTAKSTCPPACNPICSAPFIRDGVPPSRCSPPFCGRYKLVCSASTISETSLSLS